ncbi:MAG: ZPR1 zinc finger domain-containing protein [Methanotrichaceae archaeon]|nr:ZPR1 zinc finger domain-containing protein [Methanotrichaceae archaeon]
MKLTTTACCPVCSSDIQFDWETQDIPYFGEAMLIAGVCSCGFRHSDTILLCQKEPARYSLEVTDLDDLDARVIRSSSGTIRVPELGVDIEPGPASESYISNVEGVLDRIEGIVDFATRSAREAGSSEATERGEAILESIGLARQGKFKLTVVVEDPLGNSAIASEKAVRTALTDEEVACLQTGMILLDI